MAETNKPKPVTSIEHLKELSKNKTLECFIILNGGLRTSKSIDFDPGCDSFDIYNYVDGTWQEELTEAELFTYSNVGETIKKQALFYTE